MRAWPSVVAALGAMGAMLAACGSGHGGTATPAAGTPSSTTGQPSPSAQAASPTTGSGIPSVRFVGAFPGLAPVPRPTNLVEVPGEHWMLLAVQDGRILGFPNDASATAYTTVWDNRARTSREGNEEGLLGLTLDPGFAQNGFLYVYYSAAGGARRTVLARLGTEGSGPSLRVKAGSELVILQEPQPYSNHKGGQLAFGPDGMLYLGFGDGGSEGDPQGNGQDITRNWLGSIIRIDVRNATTQHPYAIPPDNPFANGAGGAKPETWAYGLRNPWRFSFDAATGGLWVGDVGQDSYEEVDVVQRGGNYGWNIMEGFHCYRPASGCDMHGLALPVTEYAHTNGACSITGGYVYRGQAIPALAGYYLFADYCAGFVDAFRVAGAAAGSRPAITVLREGGPAIASFAQDASGELYLLEFDGRIEKLVP